MIRFIRNQEIELCLESRGSGPEHALFLHGWISSRRMWYETVARLDEKRFTAHLLDFRGAGLSDRPPQGHHVKGYASYALAAMARIDAPLTLVAHSMGGRVAQYVATLAPSQLQRLILVAPGSPGGPRAHARRAQAAARAFGSRERIAQFQRAAMALPVDEAILQRLVDDALVAQREVWFGPPDRLEAFDFTAGLPKIAVPVLCLAGGKDPLAPAQRIREEIAAHIPGAVVVTLKNAGHNLPVEAPAEVAAAIARFAYGSQPDVAAPGVS